jgi:metacaspase-1
MAKGISLHIGLNCVDPKHYSGWEGKLNAAEYDANDMSLIASSSGFESNKLLRAAATRSAVISFVKDVAKNLNENDILLISYSGHGGQLPDLNSDEDDGLDETWCLYDGELVDDELYELWAEFKKNVRILVFSDSCHSGSMIKYAQNLVMVKSDMIPKFMPDQIVSNTYFSNKNFYDGILKGAKVIKSHDIAASVKLISGCQDNQTSYDGPFNGQFTGALKKVWNGGKFSGNYAAFKDKITSLLPPVQSPNYMNIGQTNLVFDNQKPFTI